jgi:hypothetical protein
LTIRKLGPLLAVIGLSWEICVEGGAESTEPTDPSHEGHFLRVRKDTLWLRPLEDEPKTYDFRKKVLIYGCVIRRGGFGVLASDQQSHF